MYGCASGPTAGRRTPSRLAPSFIGALALLSLASTALAADPPGVASLIVDLRTGDVLSSERRVTIDQAILPGSVMKVAAVAAALESTLVNERSGIVCTRRVVVDGHALTCTHPDLHRPLTPAEALTHSCNVYVATVAARLPRTAFDHALADLGLPPSDVRASVQASALGLAGARMTPRALMTALARVASTSAPPAWKPSTLAAIRGGLRNAVRDGTASAIGAAGLDALAKTGTVDAGGVSQGLVVGVTPSVDPSVGFALLASGAAGKDAASLVAPRIRAALAANSPVAATRSDSGSRVEPRAGIVRIGVVQPGGGYVVREMSLDAYVAGVIAGEQAAGSAPAALDALAIAARTYALANLGRHASEGFDLCDLTHCQVLRTSNAATRAAAERTAGRYLSVAGRPAEVFYTASCGGHTERPSAVWRGAPAPAYLPAREDEACGGEPTWTSEIAAHDLLRALRGGGLAGDVIRALEVTSRTSSGRVEWLRVEGLSPREISGENLRTLVGRTLGWQQVRSTLFEVERTASGYRFRGRGAGHGVGLCVLGAANRARRGASTVAILGQYYPGLTVQTLTPATIPAARVRIVLSVADEPQRADVQRLVLRALEQVRARLNADAPPALTIRFHPTVESYQRATGLQWFTAGVTHGAEIDLLPLGTLRERGLLDATLRHELAHAITSGSLEGQPRWMYEGVAVWAASNATSTPEEPAVLPIGAVCPADAEFTEARSAQQLRRVYAAAAACYERELKEGRTWRASRAAPAPTR